MKKIYLLLVMSCALFLTGCQDIPTLEDGSQLVAEIDGVTITADELFESLKETSGTSVLVELIDNAIVDIEIDDDSEAQTYADNYLESLKVEYEYYGEDFYSALISSGFSTEDDFVEYIKYDYLKTQVVENYLKENFTEDEINEYYESEIFGEMTVKHILITPETTDDMTDDEIATAEAEALALANTIIGLLNDGSDFEELVTEYSDDSGSVSTGGLIENFLKTDVVEEFFNASYELEIGEYTTSPVESTYGYHIILKVSENDKPELADVENDVLDFLVDEKLTEETIFETTWVKIREAYNLSIYDSILENNYNSAISTYE
ncbi:MAG: peptidylprolyl isomerase [Mycoplasmatota bacterium]